MQQWVNYTFESSSGLTEEFAQFYKDFSRELSKRLKNEWESKFSREHFFISGFLKNRQSGKYIYFSLEDVRGYKPFIKHFYSPLISIYNQNISRLQLHLQKTSLEPDSLQCPTTAYFRKDGISIYL